jgi:hypothetical protein
MKLGTHVEHNFMTVRDRAKTLIARVPWTKNHDVHLEIVQLMCLSAHINGDACRWNSWFAHQSFESLEKLSKKGMVHGLPIISHVK